MKQFLFTCVLVAFAAFASGQSANDFQKLEWLVGKWIKVNTKPGRSGFERWEATNPGSMKGLGLTLNGNDTVFIERLQLLARDNAIYYVADVDENKALTYFKLTAISNNGFTCEDPNHDFPKKIVYELAGKKLKVTTSGNGKSTDFFFEKEQR